MSPIVDLSTEMKFSSEILGISKKKNKKRKSIDKESEKEGPFFYYGRVKTILEIWFKEKKKKDNKMICRRNS